MTNTASATPPSNLAVSREPGKPPVLHTSGMRDIAAAVAWLRASRAAIAAELLSSGCLLIRGLPVGSVEEFGAVRDVLIQQRANYTEKATPRSSYGVDVYSSTDLPPAQRIQLHNENSYTLKFPGTLIFGCLVAPEEGGATILGDMRRMLDDIPPELVTRFRNVGWLLARSYGEFLSVPWSRAFGASERGQVNDYCNAHLIGYEWHDEDQLRTVQRRSAIIRHPMTNAEVWFNHIAFWNQWSLDPEVRDVLVDTYGAGALPFNTCFGDSSVITRDEIAALNEAYARVTMRESWQPGDVLIVDNILVAHGREAFRGERKILVAMGDPVDLKDCHPTVQPSAEPLRA